MNKQKVNFHRAACLDVHSPIYLRTRNSKFCGGDISDVYALVDKASEAGFSFVQFTPIQDTGSNSCPYMGLSTFSYNPIYLSLDHLDTKIDYKLIDKKLYQQVQAMGLDHVSYNRLYKFKVAVLRSIYDQSDYSSRIKIAKYHHGVVAYAIFKALRDKLKSKWYHWPDEFKKANLLTILADYPSLHREIKFYLFVQDVLSNQWNNLYKYAREKGIRFLLDKPIYPNHDSADVWANQNLFYLNPTGTLKYGSGCDNPNDPFGPQYWGHAVYKFKENPRDVINYYVQSIKFISKIGSAVRIDHALALIWKYYIIRPGNKTGSHHIGIKHKLFNKIIEEFPKLLLIAEDLGYVSNRNIDQPLLSHNIPGMRSLQWCHIPKYAKISDYPRECVAMTSSHDLDSLPSWWHKLRQNRKEIIYRQLSKKLANNFEDQIWQIVDLVFRSKAFMATISLRDMSFDMRRYNKPGIKNSQNWCARIQKPLENIDFLKIKLIIKMSEREYFNNK